MTSFLGALISLVLIDQVLKGTLLALIPAGRSVGSLIQIRPSRAAKTFAGRAGARPVLQVALWLVAFAASVGIVAHGGLAGDADRVALGAALGGAASNLLDVVVRRGVVDYVDLRFWPVFNLADVAIVLGILVVVVGG